MRVDRFSSTDDNGFDAYERERSIDKRGKEAQEVSSWASNSIVVDPSAGVVPIPVYDVLVS